MAKKKAKKPMAKSRKAPARRKAAPGRAAARASARQPKWKPPAQQQMVANLVVNGASAAIEFYKTALGAQEMMRMPGPGGIIGHAELRFGDTVLFINDAMPGMPSRPAGPDHAPTATFMYYVPDCDALFQRALAAGARQAMPLADMFWGDRMGSVVDPYGQVWMLATHTRDVSPEEMRKGAEEWAAKARSSAAQ